MSHRNENKFASTSSGLRLSLIKLHASAASHLGQVNTSVCTYLWDMGG